MKNKIVSLILLILLALPAGTLLAEDYPARALAYLSEKYDVPAEQIELYEGGIMNLEYLGKDFWFAKFTILPEGGSTPGEIRPLPDDTSVSDRGELLLPRQSDDGSVYGGVYINTRSGEILTEKEFEPLMIEDRRLAAAEWERLSREAGKLDVSLYQKLKTLSATEKVSVIIYPVFVETEELRALFTQLKADYPEFAGRLTSLSEMFGEGYLRVFPEPMPMPELTIEEMPGIETTREGSGSSPAYPGPDREFDEEYWQRSMAFYEELTALHLQGLEPGLESIRAKLDELGIDYEKTEMFITAELNKAEIETIAALADVASVHEDAIYSILPLAEETRIGAPAVDIADNSAAGSSPSPLWYLLPAIILGGLLAYFRLFRLKTQ